MLKLKAWKFFLDRKC